MNLTEYLDKSGFSYEFTEHRPTFTAQGMAQATHESGKYVAKPVVLKVDDKPILCVLPACYNINMQALKAQLGAKSVELANEDEIAKLFPDCDIGAEPPFGNLYNLPTYVDKSLQQSEHILFQAGNHEKAIRMSTKDYLKLVKPNIIEFSYRITV
jgi:Ala-tRNA(Pro) deacylase